jgi:transcriptional regulator with XRE-family HTH domain
MTLDVIGLTRARKWAASGLARELREASKVSMGEVARAVGAHSAATVQRWETGERQPSGELGARYGRLLDELMWTHDPGRSADKRGSTGLAAIQWRRRLRAELRAEPG